MKNEVDKDRWIGKCSEGGGSGLF